MGRLNVDNIEGKTKPQNSELEALIDEFGPKNELAKSLKKELEPLGVKIKEIMANIEPSKVTTKEFEATYSVAVSSSIDEVKLLAALSTDRVWAELNGLIKTKEYVDMDALENVLYHDLASEEMLEKINACQITKETPKLVVKKLKGKKK